MILVRRSAAAALANDHLTDHTAFGFQHDLTPVKRKTPQKKTKQNIL
jgi:hypothetical protein